MDTVMKDLLGQPVAVGDKVVISETGYRNLRVATITKITPKGIKASYPHPWRQGLTEETQRGIGMFVKVAQ